MNRSASECFYKHLLRAKVSQKINSNRAFSDPNLEIKNNHNSLKTVFTMKAKKKKKIRLP